MIFHFLPHFRNIIHIHYVGMGVSRVMAKFKWLVARDSSILPRLCPTTTAAGPMSRLGGGIPSAEAHIILDGGDRRMVCFVRFDRSA